MGILIGVVCILFFTFVCVALIGLMLTLIVKIDKDIFGGYIQNRVRIFIKRKWGDDD